MIQDIYPSRLNNAFLPGEIGEEDYLLKFDPEGRVLVKASGQGVTFTRKKDIGEQTAVYLFSIDDQRFFLSLSPEGGEVEGFAYSSVRELRRLWSGSEVYAAFTAYHLWKWYSDSRYCGRCGSGLVHGERERSMVCPSCGNTIYPRINPAVIVGVIHEDSLLITRYKRGYRHNALVAGFTEIGETLEETVQREVMEETGLRVKNIRYYKSQPWGMAQDILMGFYCESDGDTTIRMDDGELGYAEWVERDKIVLQPDSLSLTNEMMKRFKEGLRLEDLGQEDLR